MSFPLFPECVPRMIDKLWFNVDCPCDQESELRLMEHEYKQWVDAVIKPDSDHIPIGKVTTDHADDDEDEEEEEDEEDEESESHEDEEEHEVVMPQFN